MDFIQWVLLVSSVMKTQLRQLTISSRGAFAGSGQELSIVRFTHNSHVPYLSLTTGSSVHRIAVEWPRPWLASQINIFAKKENMVQSIPY